MFIELQRSPLLLLYTLNVDSTFYSLQHFLYPPSHLILGAFLCWIIIFLFVANEMETHKERFNNLLEITGYRNMPEEETRVTKAPPALVFEVVFAT